MLACKYSSFAGIATYVDTNGKPYELQEVMQQHMHIQFMTRNTPNITASELNHNSWHIVGTGSPLTGHQCGTAKNQACHVIANNVRVRSCVSQCADT